MKRKIKVLCGGCFNKIHAGHIYFLKKAKSFGDFLIVVLANNKNNKKPYAIPATKRKANLKKLNIVDKIIIGDPNDYTKVVKKYKPDIIVLGYDQKLKKEQKDYIKKMKIKVRRIKRYKKYSTRSL
jgi:FAD synthetase